MTDSGAGGGLQIWNSGYRSTSRRACFGVWVEDIIIFAGKSS